ncbi:hypothetical protein DB347_20415 [Opitutaceae bacterium EW11]|nr:hypothetical protein DB347_20415 [Opitutaceae bacterium EW11]
MKADLRVCWPRDWFQPHESLWSIFWKLGLANATSPELLARHFAATAEDARARQIRLPHLLAARRFDLERLAQAARIRVSDLGVVGVDQILGFEHRFQQWWVWQTAQFCPCCFEEGFHSVVFQLRGVCRCPRHHVALVSACPACSQPIPLGFGSGGRFICAKCGHAIGMFAARSTIRSSCGPEFDELIAWAGRIATGDADNPACVMNHGLSDAQPSGLSLHTPGYHRSNLFRYAAEFYDGTHSCPAPFALSAENCPVIVQHRARISRPRLRGSVTAQHGYFLLLAKHYLRLLRRFRRRMRSPRKVHSVFRSASDALRPGDWCYLLARALWEECSVWSLADYSTVQGRLSIADLTELGAALDRSAQKYFKLPEPTGKGRRWSDCTWANLHVWTAAFMQTVRIVDEHLGCGRSPDHVESQVRAFDCERLPVVLLRTGDSSKENADLYIWSFPTAHEVANRRSE